MIEISCKKELNGGGGKTTILRLIAGFEAPQSGFIKVGDKIFFDEKTNLAPQKRNIGFLFQDYALFDNMNVFKNLLFAKNDLALANKLLDICGLTSLKNAKISTLSGGQKQRVAIARALASNPKVLLCDEATSALDPATTQSILQLLKDINKRLGLTILLITHEMEVVKRICDRVAVIDKGQLIETGSVSEIFSNPKTALAQKFIQSTFHIELPPEYMEQLSAQPTSEENKPIIKFEFTGRSVDAPLLSHASKRFGIDFSILMSQIDYAGGVKFGFVIAEVTGEEEAISEARFYLIDNNVKVEVLGYVE